MSKVFRVEYYSRPTPGLSANVWIAKKDFLHKGQALDYALGCCKQFKATSRVVYVNGQDLKLVAQFRPDDHDLSGLDTVEGRAREVLLLEFVELLENQPEDLNYIRAVDFQNWLETDEGSVAYYELVKKMKKELH